MKTEIYDLNESKLSNRNGGYGGSAGCKVSNMNKRKNVMTLWKEFNPCAEKSMQDDFAKETSPYILKITTYLNKGEVILMSPTSSIDIFSGERISQTKSILTDGEFSWSNSLVYYVQKYNLQLPADFLNKILNS